MNLRALSKIKYGMYVIGAKQGDRFNGQIANTVFQVTAQPQTIAVSIARANLTHEFITAGKVFSISILAREATLEFIGRFGFKSGRNTDKFKGIDFKIGTTGVPIVLAYTIAWIEAELIHSFDVGTHTIFIGKVVNAEVIEDTKGMSYSYYHRIKGGLTPKNAPSYLDLKQTTQPAPATSPRYTCTICGYVYDPDKGDAGANIAPGTAFEQLPDTWVCPLCNAPKSVFKRSS